MNAGLWIVQMVLAMIFAGVGLLKLTRPYERLTSMMAVYREFSPRVIHLIGLMEVMGAAGIALPALTGLSPVLTLVAAVDLAIVALVSIAIHVRRREYSLALGNTVLLTLAILSAYGRWISYGP